MSFARRTDLLTSGQVAVYPVDARGLMTPPMFSAANSGRQFARNPAAMGQASQPMGPADRRRACDHGTPWPTQPAARPFTTPTAWKEAVAKSISLGSHYYTIAYTPANAAWKGDFRSITR